MSPARGVAPGWLTFRRPRKRDGEAISPNADRWAWRPALPNFFEDREKKEGTADGGAMQTLADGRHSTEIGGDRVARREALCGEAA